MGGMGGGSSMYQAGAGATVNTIAGIVQGAMRMKAAKEQAQKAADLRKEAKTVAKEILRPEFKQVQDAQTMGAMYGLNNFNRYEENIDNSVANMGRDAMAIGSSGGASLAALSGANLKALDAINNLELKDSEVRQNKLDALYNTTWNIGNEQRKLEQEQQRKKELILAEANALDKASMANKMGAHDVAANATKEGAAMFVGSSMPQKDNAVSPQVQQTNTPQNQQITSPQQTNYTTPSWYGNQNVQDTTNLGGGQTIQTTPSSFYNWSLYK